MRQRITYLQDPAEAIDPSILIVTPSSISTPQLKAAKEERITFGLDELPQELYRALKESHELHIRWVSETPFETRAPLVARLSPGLHVFWTALRERADSALLCPLLRKVFGEVECLSPEKSFTTLPRDRFSHSSATQYHAPLSSLSNLTAYLSHKLCASSSEPTCLSRVAALSTASTLEIDYDSISHALSLTTYHAPSTQPLSLSKPASLASSRMEVGILSPEKPQEVEELSLGGFLTVLGESEKPSATLFSFPARHHPTAQTFTSSFLQPTGLHPTLQLVITSSEPPLEDRACALHAHLTLPRAIFADKYQLSDPLFLASKNLSALHYISTPVDLEAPAYAMSLWGSSVLLELAPPAPGSSASSSSANQKREGGHTSQIPLHLRYLPPASNFSGLSDLEIPFPVVFWACTADEGSKFPINPFDKVNLGYDGLFGPRTLFYHLSPSLPLGGELGREGGMGGKGGVGNGRLVNILTVPVLDLDRSGYVESATAVGVLVGFMWVCWCLLGVARRRGYGSGNESGRRVGAVKKDS